MKIKFSFLGFLALLSAAAVAAPAIKPLKPIAASASSQLPKNPATNAIDGHATDNSRWISEPSDQPAWLIIDLGSKHPLAGNPSLHRLRFGGRHRVLQSRVLERRQMDCNSIRRGYRQQSLRPGHPLRPNRDGGYRQTPPLDHGHPSGCRTGQGNRRLANRSW